MQETYTKQMFLRCYVDQKSFILQDIVRFSTINFFVVVLFSIALFCIIQHTNMYNKFYFI